jgi:Zn-dependent protease/CBS domain-containing protein
MNARCSISSERVEQQVKSGGYMNSGVHIGRIFGINIQIDWSWVFIFLLVTWSLAVGLFPSWHPDWSSALSWVVALSASILFFASVLIHELAHSLVAKAKGLPVRRIILFLFGGVSNIEREPPSPKAEFIITIVGPVTSLALGAFFLMLSRFSIGGLSTVLPESSEMVSQLSPLSTLLLWLGSINILLGIFNLIPGFPLDGGRVLRSLLWMATGSLRKATRWASGTGQAIAWIFIVTGVVMIFGARIPFFGTGLINGLWLILIGWFLNGAAIAGYRQIVIRDLLEDVPVERLMRSEVPVVPPDLSVSDLVYQWIIGTDERAFPVLAGERLVGLVCLEDARKLPREAWNSTTVEQIMTRAEQLDVVSPREDANEAFEKLTRRDVRQVPVIQDGHLVGLLRRRDIVKWLQLHSELAA